MFRALDAKDQAAPAASVVGSPVAAAPAAGSPGTFTQMFRALDSAGSAPVQAAPVARMEPPAAASPRRDEGSFTQMLSAQRPQDAPGFGAPREPQRAAPSVGAWEPAPVQANAPGWGGFGESMPRELERRPEPVGGGLTQLLRTLDGPSSTPAARRDEAPVMAPPAGGPGMFTQTYQRLEERPQPAPPAPVLPPPGVAPQSYVSGATGFNQPAMPAAPPPVAGGGQSEFTRILDASRMREMGLRGGAAPVAPAQAAPVAPPVMAPMPPMQMPQMQPPMMPQAPMMQPPMQQPMMPHAGYPGGMPPGYGAPPMAPPQMAAPQMPVAPQMQPPQVAAPAASGMQKHLPMILIGVIFLLVVVVIALVFVMKH